MGEELRNVLAQARVLVAQLEALAAAETQAPVVVPRATVPNPKPIAWAGYLRRLKGDRGGKPWTPERAETFIDRVKWICEDLDIGPAPGVNEPSWLMTWMCFESARTFRADIKNPNSSGTGLIQFMKRTAIKDLNTTVEALAQMTPEDQLNFVWKYLRNRIKESGHPIRQASDGYLSILMPAYMDEEDSAVIWTPKDEAFRVNAGLDTNKDKKIVKAEVAAVIYKLLAEGLEPENVG